MDILIAGMGSIGSRHARLLAGAGHATRSLKDISPQELGGLRPDAVFITNPTSLHIPTALRLLDNARRFFIEKPLCDKREGLDTFLDEVNQRNYVTYVAYNLRFHPVIEYVRTFLAGKKVYHASIHASSYLPAWRPNADASQSYSGKAQMGGGVVWDLSHEIDYAQFLFGDIASMKGCWGRRSEVTQDSEDFADILLSCGGVPVNMHLNFLSRHNERAIKVDYEGGCLVADILNDTVTVEASKKEVVSFKQGLEQSYMKQQEYFFKNWDNTAMMNNAVEAAALAKKIMAFKEDPRWRC